MTKVEKKIFDFFQKNILWWLFAAVTALGVGLRLCGIDYLSDDYNSFLLPWWQVIEAYGADGLSMQVGNYNIPYQILIYVFTQLPLGPLYSYKLLSIIFDVILAFAAALLVKDFCTNNVKVKCLLAYSIVFCSIIVIFNSGFWGQCDSIYTSFVLLAIHFLRKEKNVLSFIMLGLAFAFKLQFVFILPLFLFYYVLTRKVSILHFLIVPATNIVVCLPAIIMGRSIVDTFAIYFGQMETSLWLHMNFPSIWAFVVTPFSPSGFDYLKNFSILLTFAVLLVTLVMMMYKKADIRKPENFMLTAIFTVFTCVIFLSSMHERYAYMLEILLIIYLMMNKKSLWICLACHLVTLRGYSYYLWQYEPVTINIAALVYFAVYVYVAYLFAKTVIFCKKDEVAQVNETQQETETKSEEIGEIFEETENETEEVEVFTQETSPVETPIV